MNLEDAKDQNPPRVVCVLRDGNGFSAEYVRRLCDSVRINWPGNVRFTCLTSAPVNHPWVEEIPLEHDWPISWCKMELFRPDLVERLGDFLYFDLDTVICGRLDDIAAVGVHTMLQSFRWKRRLASGMMFLPAGARPVIWKEWAKNPARWIRVHKWGKANGRLPGDQGFIQETWARFGWGDAEAPVEWRMHGIARWQAMCPGQVFSYKYHVRPKGMVPAGARVVCFHGDPRPHQLGWELPR